MVERFRDRERETHTHRERDRPACMRRHTSASPYNQRARPQSQPLPPPMHRHDQCVDATAGGARQGERRSGGLLTLLQRLRGDEQLGRTGRVLGGTLQPKFEADLANHAGYVDGRVSHVAFVNLIGSSYSKLL
jgi:hypothetical protein